MSRAAWFLITLTGVSGCLSRPPAAPTLTAVAGDQQVALTWNIIHDSTSYELFRAGVSGGAVQLIYSGSVASFVDQGLTNAMPGFYRVRALSGDLQGPLSQEVRATPTSGRELCLADQDRHHVAVIDARQPPMAPPLRFIGSRTMLDSPTNVQMNGDRVVVYDHYVVELDHEAVGNAYPERVLGEGGFAVDALDNEILVATSAGIAAHSSESTIDHPIERQISTKAAAVIAYDVADDEVIALEQVTPIDTTPASYQVVAYDRKSEVVDGVATPKRTILPPGSAPGASLLIADPDHDDLYAFISGFVPFCRGAPHGEILVFALSTGAPKRDLSGSIVLEASGLALNPTQDELWLTYGSADGTVNVIDRSANGWSCDATEAGSQTPRARGFDRAPSLSD